MSRQQLQDSEAIDSPDKATLSTVLNYLKARNLKVTEEALKRELGMQDDSASTPSLVHSGTEPEKYEESYSSEAPSTSPTTTRANFQLATPPHYNPSRHNNYTMKDEEEEDEDNEDTQSDDELGPVEQDEEEEEDVERDEESTMEDFSKDQSTSSTPLLRAGSRSFSWPGSIQAAKTHLEQEDDEEEEEEKQHQQREEEIQSPFSGTDSGHVSSSDKSPLWAHTTYNIDHSKRHSSSSSDGISSSQKQQHSVIVQSASGISVSTPTQIPIGSPFFYQLAPAPGQSFVPSSRQQLIAPILTVLPANTSLVNPTLARAMNISGSSQPIVLGATQGLGLSSISPQTVSITQQQTDTDKRNGLSTINFSNTEPTTGQAITSPLTEQSPVHSVAGRTSPTRTLASIPLSELTPQYTELKAFAEEFKSKRIRLGFTQGAVGQSLADKGYSNFAQSTISRFEQMQLSPTNAAAIKQVLEKWLQEAENPEAAHSASSMSNLPFMASRKRKKRAVFTPQTRTSLDNFFKQNPRPNRQTIESIANQLELLPEEVRVWFCNKRQKHKQNQTVYHYDQDLSLSTSSGANSPTSLYESVTTTKRNTPSPKTPFTIEELSKSSSTSTTSAVTPTHLTSPFMSPTSLVMAVTTPKVFFNPSAPVTTTTTLPRFLPSPPWPIAGTTA